MRRRSRMSRRPAVAVTQAAATKAEAAADTLLAWLQFQPRVISPRLEATSRVSEEGEARADPFSVTPGTDAVEPEPRIAMAVRQAPPDLSDAATPVRLHEPVPRERPCCTEAGHDGTWTQWSQPTLLFRRYGHSSGVQTPTSGSGQRQRG